MKVVICAIAKNENPYINDWVNWHINIGFDHIYLFDNNDSKEDFVGNFIDRIDSVTIYDVRDRREESLQSRCYNKFYRENKEKFYWCLFIDIDEFLYGVSDIKKFLCEKKFDNFDQIRITWKTFSDSNLLKRDTSIPVYESFNDLSKNKELNKQAKPFIRGGLGTISISPHRGVLVDYKNNKIENLKSCLSSGTSCKTNGIMSECVLDDLENETVFINHYRTKSLKEFIDQKLNRGDACSLSKTIDFDYYWVSNDRTEEKEKFIREYLMSRGDEIDVQQ